MLHTSSRERFLLLAACPKRARTDEVMPMGVVSDVDEPLLVGDAASSM